MRNLNYRHFLFKIVTQYKQLGITVFSWVKVMFSPYEKYFTELK